MALTPIIYFGAKGVGGNATVSQTVDVGTGSGRTIFLILASQSATGTPSDGKVAGVSIANSKTVYNPFGNNRSQLFYGSIPDGTTGSQTISGVFGSTDTSAARVYGAIFSGGDTTTFLENDANANDGTGGTSMTTRSITAASGDLMLWMANSSTNDRALSGEETGTGLGAAAGIGIHIKTAAGTGGSTSISGNWTVGGTPTGTYTNYETYFSVKALAASGPSIPILMNHYRQLRG